MIDIWLINPYLECMKQWNPYSDDKNAKYIQKIQLILKTKPLLSSQNIENIENVQAVCMESF